MQKEGRIVFRVSGSIGAMDLICLKRLNVMYGEGDWGYNAFGLSLEQVKGTKGDVFYFDKRSKDEWARLYDFTMQGVKCVFQIWLGKPRKWVVLEVRNKEPPKGGVR